MIRIGIKMKILDILCRNSHTIQIQLYIYIANAPVKRWGDKRTYI